MGYGGRQSSRSGDIRRFNFTGNGSNTAFDLGFTPATQNQLIVTVNGLVQHYDAFSISGSTITFDGTPASGDTIQITAVVDAVGVAAIPDGAVANVSTLTVSGNSTFTGSITGTATFANTTAHTGAATFANTVAVTGVLTAAANVNFDSGTLFVDGTNNRVGINTTTTTSGCSLNVLSGDVRIENTSAAVRTRYVAGSNQWNVEASQSSNQFGIYDSVAGLGRFFIDSAGRVTRPYQPCFQATGSFTPGTGIVAINSIGFDIGSNFNTSTYRFTAPVAGRYHFWGSVSYYTGTSGHYVRHGQLAILKNGATNLGMSDFTYYNNIGNNQHRTEPVQLYASLAASDYVELNVITWSASGSFTNYGCYFGGQLIG